MSKQTKKTLKKALAIITIMLLAVYGLIPNMYFNAYAAEEIIEEVDNQELIEQDTEGEEDEEADKDEEIDEEQDEEQDEELEPVMVPEGILSIDNDNEFQIQSLFTVKLKQSHRGKSYTEFLDPNCDEDLQPGQVLWHLVASPVNPPIFGGANATINGVQGTQHGGSLHWTFITYDTEAPTWEAVFYWGRLLNTELRVSHTCYGGDPTGQINITKIVENEEEQVLENDNTQFTINVSGNNYSENVIITGNGSSTISNLSYGTYTISEIVPSGYQLLSITVNGVETDSVILNGQNNNVEVVIVNMKECIPITLANINEAITFGNVVNGQITFTINEGYCGIGLHLSSYIYPDGYYDPDWTGEPWHTQELYDDVYEFYRPGTYTISVEYPDCGLIQIDFYTGLHLGDGEWEEATVINPPHHSHWSNNDDSSWNSTRKLLKWELIIGEECEEETGSITINKVLYSSDEEIIEEDETEFTVQVTGPNGYDETFTFSVDEPMLIEDLELGEYTITEIDIPEGYTFEYMSPSDGVVNLNIEELHWQVTIYNMVKAEEEEETGAIRIIKKIGSSIGPFQTGVTFNITITEGSPISGVTDTNGEILFENLVPGEYLVEEIVPAGYSTNLGANHTVTVVANETTVVNVINSVIVIDDDPPIVIIDDDDPIPLSPPPTTPPVVTEIANEEEVADLEDEIEEIIEEDVIPLATVEIIPEEEEEVDIILDEDIPLASSLPQTGEASPLILYGLGSLVAALGYGLKKRK